LTKIKKVVIINVERGSYPPLRFLGLLGSLGGRLVSPVFGFLVEEVPLLGLYFI